MDLIISVITFTCITLIGVMGVFTVTGLTGLFSFGQAAFMAVGAYVAGVLGVKYNLPFPLAILIALCFGFLAGLIVGLPTIKLRRDYISLVTFGFGEAIIAILNNTSSITGGAMGLSGIPKRTTFILVLISAAVCIFIVSNFKYSKYGRQCLALRSDELAARSMGIDVNRVKLIAFLLAAVMTSYAGVMYGYYTTYVEPGMFDWTVSAEWIIIVFFGGINSLTGAVISALALASLPELLRFASEWRIVIYCVIVLVIINFRSSGIFGEYELFSKGAHKRKVKALKK